MLSPPWIFILLLIVQPSVEKRKHFLIEVADHPTNNKHRGVERAKDLGRDQDYGEVFSAVKNCPGLKRECCTNDVCRPACIEAIKCADNHPSHDNDLFRSSNNNNDNNNNRDDPIPVDNATPRGGIDDEVNAAVEFPNYD